MIVELFLTPIFSLLKGFFAFINNEGLDLPTWIDDTLKLIAKGMMFFPVDVYVIVIANIALWLTIQFGWAIIEWLYKKIPGIN